MAYFTYEEFFGFRQISACDEAEYRSMFALERAEAIVIIELGRGLGELDESQLARARAVVFALADVRYPHPDYALSAEQKAELALIDPVEEAHSGLVLFKLHARIDHSDDDALLAHYLTTAEEWIANYCDIVLADLSPVPAGITTAVMQLAAHWYENREASGSSLDVVPFGVLDLIQPYRQWTFQHVE